MKKPAGNTFSEEVPKSRIKLLFVDYNPSNNLHDLHGEIEFSGATVQEALNIISKKQSATDAVVVNAMLGFSEIKTLKKTTDQRDLPLILYTPDFDQEINDMALTLGVDDYFSGSMLYTFASRIKFIMRLREFKIQWLKQESEHKHNKNEEPVAWHFFQKRLVDIIVSSIALILSSPVILVIALAKEIEYIENNVFSNSKNARLMDRIFNWYEFLVLIMFSPIFLLISIPLKIGSKQEYLFSISKNVGVEHRIFDQYKFNTELTHPHPRHANKRSTWLGMLLIKTGLVELPLLINVLKGDISFFGGRSLEIRGVKKTKDQNENQFLTQTNIMGLRHAHQG